MAADLQTEPQTDPPTTTPADQAPPAPQADPPTPPPGPTLTPEDLQSLLAETPEGAIAADGWKNLQDRYQDPRLVERLLEDASNVQRMQAEAHRRNEEAARLQSEAKAVLDFLSQKPAEEAGELIEQYRQGKLQLKDTERERLAEEVRALKRDLVQQRIETFVEGALQGEDSAQRPYLRETLRQRVALRFIHDPDVTEQNYRDLLAPKIRGFVAEERQNLRRLQRELLLDFLQTKERAARNGTPSSRGPQGTVPPPKTKPAPKIDFRRDEGWRQAQQQVRDMLREAQEQGEL